MEKTVIVRDVRDAIGFIKIGLSLSLEQLRKILCEEIEVPQKFLFFDATTKNPVPALQVI